MIILVTGGCGFIGSNFIRHVLAARPDVTVVNLDKLTYAGNLLNLADIEQSYERQRYLFVHGDIADRSLVSRLFASHRIQVVVNFAAESHVDRSIEDAAPFISTNVAGVLTLMQVCLEFDVEKFIQVSTDEVYGTLGESGKFTETTPLAPNSPYSASKAGADLLVRAFFHTHSLQACITRCSNNYGPYQFPEKLIPLMILRAMRGEPLPVYGDGLNVRDWIHVHDHCRGILLTIESGKPGKVYNFGGSSERTNLEVVTAILRELDRPTDLIRFVPDRPGHDRRYAIDFSLSEHELGYRPQTSIDIGLKDTISWYRNNSDWCAAVESGAYREHWRTWRSATETDLAEK